MYAYVTEIKKPERLNYEGRSRKPAFITLAAGSLVAESAASPEGGRWRVERCLRSAQLSVGAGKTCGVTNHNQAVNTVGRRLFYAKCLRPVR